MNVFVAMFESWRTSITIDLWMQLGLILPAKHTAPGTFWFDQLEREVDQALAAKEALKVLKGFI